MTEQTQGTYVYGVVRGGASLDAVRRGGDGLADVHLVEADDLAAVVSSSPERATRDSVLGHAQVLEAALESSPVVPLRFGLVLTDEDAVRREILDAHHDKLVELLQRFDGRVQMTLKAYYDEEAIVGALMVSEPELQRLREVTSQGSEEQTYKERVRLGELINKGLEQRRGPAGNEILERLKPLAVAVELNPPEDELMVAHAAFLIERARQHEFEEALEAVAREHQELMRFRLLGPMPPYDFVEMQEPAWA